MLDEAVESLLNSTAEEFEVLLVNDNSQDDGPARAASWGLLDSRVRPLCSPGSGLVDALNFGLYHAQGEFIARMDADDICHKERLAIQLKRFDRDPSLTLVDGRVSLFRDDGEPPEGMRLYIEWLNTITEPSDFDRELLVESPIIHPAATFKKRAVVTIGGYRDGPFPEDYDLWLRLHAAGHRFAKVKQEVLRMRDRPDRLTRTDSRYGKEGFRLVRQRWLKSGPLAQTKRVALLGGGRCAKAWLKWLQSEGHTVCAMFDVTPSKIGTVRPDGIPVLSIEDLSSLKTDLALVAVAGRGARENIRDHISQSRPQWAEGRDWWAVI